jgi:hypothetical protein
MKIKELFHLKEIEPNIFLLEFESRSDLAYTFLRPQEYYENPHFRDTIFTHKQFEKWYKKFKNRKRMTYHTDWSGFNIPSYILDPFFSGEFKGITTKERALLDMFKDKKQKFYVIGCQAGATHVLNHEVTHARFYLNDKYRKEVLRTINKYDVKELYQILSKNMYDYKTWDDEINAYLVNRGSSMFAKRLKDPKSFDELMIKLREISKKYFN